MTSILVPFMFFATIVAIVLGSIYFSHQSRVQKYKVIEKMLDHGQTLTPDMLESLNKAIISGDKPNQAPFGQAVFQILIGIGLAVFFWAMSVSAGTPSFLIAVGVFPFVIGLARLITVFYEKR